MAYFPYLLSSHLFDGQRRSLVASTEGAALVSVRDNREPVMGRVVEEVHYVFYLCYLIIFNRA